MRYIAGIAVTKPFDKPPAEVAAAWQTAFSFGPKIEPVIRDKDFRIKKPKMALQ
jgi:hypothetical protein